MRDAMSIIGNMSESMKRNFSHLPAVLGGLLLCVAPLPWSIRFLSYAHPKESLILGLGLLCGLAWLLAKGSLPIAHSLRGFALLVLPIAAWFVWALLLEAPYPGGWAGAITGAGVLLAALALAPLAAMPHHRAQLDGMVLSGAAVVAILGLMQYFQVSSAWMFPVYAHYDQRMYSVFGNQDLLGGYMAVALVMIWALAPLARLGGLFALLLLQLPLAGALLVSGCRSAWAAALVGCLLAAYGNRPAWRRSLLLAAPLVALGVAGLAFAWESTGARLARVLSATDIGGSVRLWIWDASLRMVAKHPLAGVGPGQFAYASPRHMGEALNAQGDGVYAYNEAWAMHPHSEPLNLVAEGGMAGALLAAVFLALLWRGARLDRAWPALTAMMVFALVNDAWHSAPHALLSLWLLSAATAPTRAVPEASRAGRLALCVLVLAQAALFAAHAALVLRPSWLLTRAEDLNFAGKNPEAAYEAAAAHPFVRAEAQLGLAVYHTRLRDWPRAAAAAHEAQHALDTHMVHWLEGQALAQDGDTQSAKMALEKCLARAPKNQPAFDLLWRLTEDSRALELLREHAKRWNLRTPE